MTDQHANETERLLIQAVSKVWGGMKQRCLNPRAHNYQNYGGRGITICDRWINSVANFAADMGPRPPGTSIDRIDNDGNYEPGNCRWATAAEQNRNKRHGGPAKANSLKTHCIRNHPLTGWNLIIGTAGNRHCRACQYEIMRVYRARHREMRQSEASQ